MSDPGGVPPPSADLTQPFQWQGKRLMAPGLYDSRARVWSADLGAFLQPDEYVSSPGSNKRSTAVTQGKVTGKLVA